MAGDGVLFAGSGPGFSRLAPFLCSGALTLGRGPGSNRTMRTLGRGLYPMQSHQGLCAETAAMAVVGASSLDRLADGDQPCDVQRRPRRRRGGPPERDSLGNGVGNRAGLDLHDSVLPGSSRPFCSVFCRGDSMWFHRRYDFFGLLLEQARVTEEGLKLLVDFVRDPGPKTWAIRSSRPKKRPMKSAAG